ncbi:hypothetical protein [Streptomyces sp. ML-6]|uniref:hypothetical protein n=1 Tax=Streptomyces sp. ML-6 TaxID=2982693 RepID=UPI0024BFCA44|nr:hypothetical protein [Streptomyces sp. ML-6]MDK0524199.1 hypothetical protein [Streptomyces sp. ML-6]
MISLQLHRALADQLQDVVATNVLVWLPIGTCPFFNLGLDLNLGVGRVTVSTARQAAHREAAHHGRPSDP